jgi:hypothetical protein
VEAASTATDDSAATLMNHERAQPANRAARLSNMTQLLLRDDRSSAVVPCGWRSTP